MATIDQSFADQIKSALKGSGYTVFYENRDPHPACVFLAERRSEDELNGVHVTVVCVDGEWVSCQWTFLGNLASPVERSVLRSVDVFRDNLELPWRQDIGS